MLSTNFLSGGGSKGDGVNLLTGTKDFSGASKMEGTIENEKYNDFTVVHGNAREISNAHINVAEYLFPNYESGGSYTLSFFAKGTGAASCFFYEGLYVESSINSQEFRGSFADGASDINLSSEWGKYWIRWKLKNGDTSSPKKVLIRALKGNDVYACGLKLERGSTPTPWTPAPEDVVTKTPPDIFEALDSIPEMHRNIFRGKNLGTVFTDAQKAAIADGSFHDLWVGDYWVINSHTWRIVDINYWYNKGDQSCTTPHIVVMPDASLYYAKMNDTPTSDGGYVGSDMYKNGLDQAKEIVNTDFGERYVLNHRIMLSNKTDGGHASGGTWYNSTVELPNEIMIYGCHILMTMNNGVTIPYLQTTDYTQLALFRLVPTFANTEKQWFWLRDVVLANAFAVMGGNLYADAHEANYTDGVRPVFGVTGGTASADEPGSDLEITSLSTKGGDPL